MSDEIKDEIPQKELEQDVPTPEIEQSSAQDEQVTQSSANDEAQDETAQLRQCEDKFLRLAAEYDNYRKRTAKEKESLWTQAKAETVIEFLPVYDNLERALKQETQDKAFQKGVEMTMNQLKEVLAKLGVEEIPALGETFDPACHNAVMHIEDENLTANTVAEVFQAGFRCGEKIVRFSMVKVAN